MKKINKIFLAVLTLFTINLANIKADEIKVARINDTDYTSLDEAINAASDEATIELLNDAETTGMNLNKNIIIEGNNKTLTFNDKGIALWGKKLTFKNTIITMTGVDSTPYTAEWNWQAICASKNSELNLINSNMTMDGTNAGNANAHAIYFTGNDKLNLTNSTLSIKNYNQDALEWDGGDGGYNINLIDSTFTSDHNRSGFTGTFVVKAENSNINVINNTGNGSNGSHFELINSLVDFSSNGSHGLSAGNLTINNSTVTANSNGGNGIHVTGKLEVTNNSTVTIANNDCHISSKWTFPGALYIGGNGIIDNTTNLTINNNNGSGIYIKERAELTLETGLITKNIAAILGQGGGINNHGTINISEGVEINNNSAEISGDDIYSEGVINLPEVIKDRDLIEVREDEKELNDCNHTINGWYDDNEETRWEAHAEDPSDNYINQVNKGIYEGTFSIKAAHDDKGTLIINYVDSDGNKLTEEIITEGKVGEKYTTEKKDFEGYTFITVEGEPEGIYTEETINVTYYYDKNIGTGNIEELPPQTGFNGSNITTINVETITLYKKED